jgi:acetyl esterase
MDELAERLAAEGVEVTHRRFAETDHGFTHSKPVETAREAITMMGDNLLSNLAER